MSQVERSPYILGAVCAAATILAACDRAEPTESPVATASVSLSRSQVRLGSPVDVTYRFVPVAGASFDEDYRVMVHFVDADEELMWTDDHEPPTPTTRWTPGVPVEYTRTVFVPIYPYVGEPAILVGLYSASTGRRLPLAGGPPVGRNAFKLGALLLLPQTGNVVTQFKAGWHPAEVDADPWVEWRWTEKTAALSFRNPKTDVLFYFDVDNPSASFQESQQVAITLGGQTVAEVTVRPSKRELHKIPITSAQLGDSEVVDMQIEVDKSFVPAPSPGSSHTDARELGVRVFHAFIDRWVNE